MAERDPKTGRFPKGNGAGWGGPRMGKGNKGAGPGRPIGIANGEGKAARARAALEEFAPLAVKTITDIASNIDDQRALAAALSVLNRIGLHEKSGVEHTGAGAGPIKTQVTVRIVRPGDHGEGGV
jgi:hypothetical protein